MNFSNTKETLESFLDTYEYWEDVYNSLSLVDTCLFLDEEEEEVDLPTTIGFNRVVSPRNS